MKSFETIIILGVGVVIGWHIAKWCTGQPPPKREAKTQPFDPRYVEKHGDKARSRETSSTNAPAAYTTQAELPA